jgi:hypothetical protein
LAVETGVVEGVRLESENFELWNGSTESRPDGEFPVASFQMPDKTAPPGVEDSARIVLVRVLLLVLEAMGWCVWVGGLAGIEYEYRPAG